MNKENTLEEAAINFVKHASLPPLEDEAETERVKELIQQQRQAAVEELLPLVRAVFQFNESLLKRVTPLMFLTAWDTTVQPQIKALPESIINLAKGE